LQLLVFSPAGWGPPASRDRDSTGDEISILKENISPEEILTQSIKSATRTDQLLENIEKHIKSVRPNTALHALRTLFLLYKSDKLVFIVFIKYFFVTTNYIHM
jgi:hypothetical protein